MSRLGLKLVKNWDINLHLRRPSFISQYLKQLPTEQYLSTLNKGQSEEIAEILTILVPVLSSVVVTIILVIACCCWIHSSTLNIKSDMAKNTPKVPEEDFDLDDFKAMTNEIDEKRPKQPRPKTSEHVIKISDDGQERPKSVRPPEMNKPNGLSNGNANGTVLLGFSIWTKFTFYRAL